MQLVKRHFVMENGRRFIDHLKTFFIDNHMVIFALPILFATILHSRFSREQELKNLTVMEGRIVSCRQSDEGGTCIADIEFRMGNARVKKRSVRLMKSGNCLIGQKVKAHYSPRSKHIDIIE